MSHASRHLTVAQIAQLLGGVVQGQSDLNISGLAKIEDARAGELTFLSHARYTRYLETTKASAILAVAGTICAGRTLIIVPDPYSGFLQLLHEFYPQTTWVLPGVHPTAVVEASAELGASVSVGAFSFIGPHSKIGDGTIIYPHVVIGADVTIGENCKLYSRVSIRERVTLGDRVIVQDGAVIGSDGFGFLSNDAGYLKIPQTGRVIIGDDVEIGANTTIDRATLGETVVGSGTKLDNLIQVAHNVTIGSHTVIAAQTGISGSTRIGDNCRIGGQVGFNGHIVIGDRVAIAAQSGIAGDVADGDIVAGSPARHHTLWKRIEAALTRLPDLTRRVRKLEQSLGTNLNDETKTG